MKEHPQTVEDLAARIRSASPEELVSFERTLAADTRVTVKRALESARKRIAAQQAERMRVQGMFDNQRELSGGALCMGLDEVGRGPLAGPLTIGAVVLPDGCIIEGLNDSKQVPEAKRDAIAQEIRACARAWTVVHIPPEDIDAKGMSACLKHAFSTAIAKIDASVDGVGTVLIDGNPLHIDTREINVVKGDTICASIAAASIIAKVDRDALMRELDERYPGYGFASNKGYGSSDHQAAIREQGLSPVHRASFCTSFLQDTLF